MQQFKLISSIISALVLMTTISATTVWPQSGRGRPRVPAREPTPSPPAAVKVPDAAAVVKQEQAGNIARFVLRNGLTVIISEQHAAPIAATVAYFKAGRADEPDAARGVAQLLERLALSATSSRPPGRAAYDLRAVGGLFNADTTLDATYYCLITPPEKIKNALAIQAGMIQRPSLVADDLRREALAVIEENKQKYDSPSTYSKARLYEIAFPGRRLGIASSAADESLRAITPEQIAEFYRAHYRPDNLIIVVVGDVLTFNTLVEIQQLYGEFKASTPAQPAIGNATGASGKIAVQRPGAAKPATAPQPGGPQQPVKTEVATPVRTEQEKTQSEAGQPGIRYATDRADINQTVVSIGFEVPEPGQKDLPAVEVLTALMGQGRGSRLHTSLVDGQGVVSRLESSYSPGSAGGLLTIQMWLSPGSIDKAESAFFKEVDQLRREVPGEVEMARAKAMLEKKFVDQTGTYAGRAQAIARAEATSGGFHAMLDYKNLIRAVRAEDVQRVAARYLTLANTAIHEYEPFSAPARTFDADRFTATVLAWAPTFAQAVNLKDARAAEIHPSLTVISQGPERSPEEQAVFESVQPLPVKDFSTLNGPRAFVREDHSQPKVTVALLFQGGRLLEDDTTSGTTELMLRAMLYGTPRRTPAQIANELEQLGAEIEVVAEPDFFGFLLSVLSRNADRALKTLRDLIEEPAFRDPDVERARSAQIGLLREDRDRGIIRARELLLHALFPGSAYSLPSHGREEVVSKLTGKQVSEWHARTVKRQIPIAIIVGDTDGSALVSGEIAEGFKRRDVDTSLQVRVPQPPKPAEKIEQRRRLHTAAAIGMFGPKAGSADLPVIELIEAAMNGTGGRLLTELKDRQNIAYDAGFGYEALFTAGSIYAYFISPPENELRARAGLIAEFERLARAGLSAEEAANAGAVATTSKLVEFQSQARHALEYSRAAVYSRGVTEVDLLAERFSKISAEDIKRVAATYFKPSAVSAGILRGTSAPRPQSPQKQSGQ